MNETQSASDYSQPINCLFNAESVKPPLTGIGRYTWELMAALNKNSDVSSIGCFTGTNVVGYSPVSVSLSEQSASVSTEASGEHPNQAPAIKALVKRALPLIKATVRAIPGTYQLRSRWLNRTFKRLAKSGWGIYHEPNFILKPFSGLCVTTIHDLSFIHYPQYHPRERVEWLTRELPKTLKRADAIITDSQLVKAELIAHFAVPEEKITPIYLAANTEFKPRPLEQLAQVMKHHQLDVGKYVLCVCTIEPRKGIDSLLNAWEKLPKDQRNEHQLVLVGATGWQNRNLLARIKKLQKKGEVRYLSFVSQQDLPFIYNGAKAFVYPSIYEGFGLPVLEAMQSGIATVCREGTSCAEFSGDGALTFDTDESLADIIYQLLDNEDFRASLSIQGLERSKSFSWKKCADETLSVYNSIL